MTPTPPAKKDSSKLRPPKLVTGMKDILPEDQLAWDWVRSQVDRLARDYRFERIDTPILESESLVVRTVGEFTDIVEKELYSFLDKDGERLVLRPEFTASLARAYVEHGMINRPKPVRLYSLGPLFRRERPQAGRYRQHWQVDFELIGDAHPVGDAQIILIAANFLREFGLDIDVNINSIGSADTRKIYIKLLVDYYKTRKNKLCEDCKKRLLKNPLRLLDCKVETCQALTADAPQIVDHLSEDDNRHFTKVLEHLDDVDLTYTLNPRLVRGLDYYNRTVFEILPATTDGHDKRSTLCGGGRYDGLIELIGGQPTPAVGFGLGVERLISQLKASNLTPPAATKPLVYLAQLGEMPRKHALRLFEEIRRAGIPVAENFSKEDIKTQLENANKLGVPLAVIIGQKEILDDTVLFRDMENGVQEVVDIRKTVPELQKRLQKKLAELSANGRG